MIPHCSLAPSSTRVYLACGATDMRKGFDGLAVLVQQVLEQSPHSGALFAFRGKRGDLIKLLWYDGQGMCLFSKRMDRGKFVWPVTKTGKVHLTSAQLSMLLEGIDWPHSKQTSRAHNRARFGGINGRFALVSAGSIGAVLL